MTKSKHTPAPWAWEKSHLGEGGYTYQSLVPAELADHPDYEGGEAIVFHCAGWKIKKADAALIAAAPELLKALEQALRFIEVRENYKGAMTAAEVEKAIKNNKTTLTEIGANSCNTLASFNFEKAREAIAKAEGSA